MQISPDGPNQKKSNPPMIVVCPTCATHHDLKDDHLDLDGTMIRCAVCGHSWIESRALSVVEAGTYGHPVSLEIDSNEVELFAELEVARLAQAARLAGAKLAAAKKRRRKELRGWAMLATCLLIPLSAGLLAPQDVARGFPPARVIYSMAGIDIKVGGLEFRNVGQQHKMVDGVRVLAIQGEIVNVGNRERKIPPLKFMLRNDRQQPVYDWQLTATTRPVKPGEVSTFVTRVASPPESAQHIEIRFAPPGETGSNAGHDGSAH
jgi:predicted Zn finger-like uncharacterized protein